jgi:DNA-binding PucR family transcriptional regulator
VRRGPIELRASLERIAGLLSTKHAVELRAGVSSLCGGLAGVARAHGEAARALRHTDRDNRVVALEEIGLRDYLAEGADETARRLISAGTTALLAADERQNGALCATLRSYAECDLNVARTAERLTVHPNTVHYRLRRVRELSGHDPRRFDDLAELLTALRLLGRG